MKTFLTFLVWLPFAGSLGFLSFQGALACKLPEPVAAGLAACLTCAGSVYAGRFRSTRSWVDFAGMVLTLAMCTVFDWANLLDTIQRRAGAEVMKATAGASADAAEVERLRVEVSEAEKAWIAARDLAEAERTQGKVSGHAGKGSTFDRLTAEAENMETVLHRREAALREASAQSKVAKVTVAEKDGGRHILALVPPWVLLVGAAALELSLAGLGWGMGAPVEPRKKRQSSPCHEGWHEPCRPEWMSGSASAEQRPQAARPEALQPSAQVARNENENEIAPGDDDGSKVIPIAAEELKILARLARRAYRKGGFPTLRAVGA